MFYIKCTQKNAEQIKTKGFVTLNLDSKCAIAMNSVSIHEMRLCETTKKGLICSKIEFDNYEPVEGNNSGTRFYIKDIFNEYQRKKEKEKNDRKKKSR